MRRVRTAVAAGCGVFALTLVGLLLAQDGGGRAPEVAPPAPGGAAPAVAGRDDGTDRRGGLWRFPSLDSRIGPDELNAILRRAKAAEARGERELLAFERRRAELDARERDIQDRQEAVLLKLQEVEQMRAQVQAEIAAFRDTVVEIRSEEERNLKAVGRSLAELDPRKGAGVLLEMWKTEDGKARAMKIWTLMDPDAANDILAELDVPTIAEVLRRRAKVSRERARDDR